MMACGGNGKTGSEVEENGAAEPSSSVYYIEQKTSVTEEGYAMEMFTKGWFDVENDFSAVEMEYETFFLGDKVAHKGLFLTNHTGSYSINLIRQTGYKLTAEELDDEDDMMEYYTGDSDEFEQLIVEQGGAVVGHETILGKRCTVVEMEEEDDFGDIVTATYWFYKGIPLKMVAGNTKMETLKVDFNATAPEGVFDIPEGITIIR